MVLQGLFFSFLVASSNLWAAGGWLEWLKGATKNSEIQETSGTPHIDERALSDNLDDAATRTHQIQTAHRNGIAVRRLASDLGYVPNPSEMRWLDLLEQRVIPHSLGQQALVVAYTGVTKGGKSSALNRAAGAKVVATGPVAGLTKQSTVLAHPSLADAAILAPLFPSMTLVRRKDLVGATLPSGLIHYLEIEPVPSMPPDLLFVDTPDFDSTEIYNWQKARGAATMADVIVAMITPDKHGDDVGRRFYQSIAAESNKPVVLVINKVHLSQIEKGHWKAWLRFWCGKTGIQPIAAYVVPFDEDAAESQSQDFFRVEGDLSLAAAGEGEYELTEKPVLFSDELRQLDVPRLKKRANDGSLLQAMNGDGGLIGFLDILRGRSEEYHKALRAIELQFSSPYKWPEPPHAIMQVEIERWWNNNHRTDIAAQFQSYTEWLNVTAYFGTAADARRKTAVAQHALKEEAAVADLAQKLFDLLEPLRDGSSQFFSPNAVKALKPAALSNYVAGLRTRFSKERPVDVEFAKVAKIALPAWAKENPNLIEILRVSDTANSVVVRPGITLLGAIGGIVGPHLVGAHWVTHNFFTGGLSTVGGGAIAERASALLNWGGTTVNIREFYYSISDQYKASQIQWVYQTVLKDLFGPILEEVRRGKAISESPQFQTASSCAERLVQWAQAAQTTED
jgi:hypothetical protein